jgi:hypothetical protein
LEDFKRKNDDSFDEKSDISWPEDPRDLASKIVINLVIEEEEED